MFPDRLIVDDSLTETADGFSFELRVPWYRALPVASFTSLEMTLDGTPVDGPVWVTVNGRRDAFGDLASRYEDYWYVLDPARVDVDWAGVEPRDEHTLSVTLGLRIPYIMLPDGPWVLHEWCTKTLRAKAGVKA